MRTKNDLSNQKDKSIERLIWLACAITIYFNPALQDPFNSPKQWILFILSAWILGYLVVLNWYSLKKMESQKFFILIIIFNVTMFFASIFTDVTYVALFGDTQRKLGFLTYFCFSLVMIYSSMYVRQLNIRTVYYANFFMGLVVGIYGLMQSLGEDFIEWNNPYNRIIGTLGNPNFASSIMAICTSISFAVLFIRQFSIIFKLMNFTLILILLNNIYLSSSLQGLVGCFLGISVILFISIYTRNKILSFLTLGSFLILFIIAVLGMLQKGPFAPLLYKESVSVRGFYWEAAIRMFQSNPIWGIGIDRYGAYFREYRNVEYPLTYGFDITSSNAHNTFLQMFATGGFLVGLSYLSIILFILYRCSILVMKAQPDFKILCSGIIAAWLIFVAQSVISIDNIGLTIWGWVYGGLIVGLSYCVSEIHQNGLPQKVTKLSKNVSLLQPVISGIFALTAILLISVLYRGETISMQARNLYNVQNPTQSAGFSEKVNLLFKTSLVDPYYKLKMAELLTTLGDFTEPQIQMEKLIEDDPRNVDFLLSLAMLAEYRQNYGLALKMRERITIYDPWNAKNYLEMGRDYKIMGNYEKMLISLNKIKSFASKTDEARLAEIELVRS